MWVLFVILAILAALATVSAVMSRRRRRQFAAHPDGHRVEGVDPAQTQISIAGDGRVRTGMIREHRRFDR